MFSGTHLIIYSKDAEADRKFLSDVVGFDHVDAGGGWLIFSLPPAELGCHPHAASGAHEIFFLCDDVNEARKTLSDAGVESAEPVDQGYGIESSFLLPGGSQVGFYQPKHSQPI